MAAQLTDVFSCDYYVVPGDGQGHFVDIFGTFLISKLRLLADNVVINCLIWV